MLSLFPSLLSYGEVAPFLYRLILGIILIFWSYKTLRKTTQNAGATPNVAPDTASKKVIDGVLGLVGIMLILGFLTQAMAIIVLIDLIIKIVHKAKNKALFTDGVNYYVILFIIALGLLLSGPGILSIDLPL